MSVESRELVERVRELHKPRWDHQNARLCCFGCEGGDYADSSPKWPCPTALLVYTQAEQDAVADNLPV